MQTTQSTRLRGSPLTTVAAVILAAFFMAACGAERAQPTPIPPTVAPATVAPSNTAPTTAAPATLAPSAEQVTPTAVAEAAAPAGCPAAADGAQLVVDDADGICFLIPARFEAERPGTTIVLYGPATTPGHRERGIIEITPIEDASLEANVQAIVEDVVAALPGFTPTQSNLTVAGLPAIQLDNMPGQDINRQVFVVANNRLYRLTFFPVDAERPDAFAEMETLQALVLATLQFIAPESASEDTTTRDTMLLDWTGTIEGTCYRMTIYTLEGEVMVSTGVCGDSPSVTVPLRNSDTEWAAIQAHFGETMAETPAGTISFQGQGSASGELWANALATWARFTAMETISGSTSASARTTLAWSLGEIEGQLPGCVQLVVLAYGYSYAMIVPCEGGPATIVGEGWLTDAELATFGAWVNEGARIETEAGYLDAQGATPLNAEEVAAWAQMVYDRMASGG